MRTRLFTVLGTAAVLATALLAPATAQAAASECSIISVSPEHVTIGLKPVTVQFDVSTDCDDDEHQIEWSVAGALIAPSHVSWFGACTYSYMGAGVFHCPEGKAPLDVIGSGHYKGSAMAGEQKIYAYAFDDLDGDGTDDDGTGTRFEGSFNLLRRTTWGTTFNAGPAKKRKGQTIKLTGQVSRADWDRGSYQKFGTYVQLQFKADNAQSYQTVRSVWDNGASATTSVKATRSGSFRYYYPGDAKHAPSTSRADHVKVLPAERH